MSIQATHLGDVVAEALLGQDLGDAVFSHPRFVAVPQAMGRQSVLDRQPAGEGASSEGCCPLPGQCSLSVLWVTIFPSRRNLTACPQDGQWPMPSVLTR